MLPGGTLDVIGNASAAVPAATTPLDAQASTAYPALHGCHVGYGATAPASRCVFGDVAARRTVILVGDSHAAQWFPALERLAEREHFRLVSWTKSGCPFTLGVHIYLPALGRDYTECLEWQQHVLHDLGVAATRDDHRRADIDVPPAGPDPGRRSGLLERGGPDLGRGRRRHGQGPATARSTGRRPPGHAARALRHPRVHLVGSRRDGALQLPLRAERPARRRRVCRRARCRSPAHPCTPIPRASSAPGAVCQAEVDGIIVYRDDNHITAAFAASRWRQFAEALGNEQRRRPI